MNAVQQFQALRGQLAVNEPMSRHTSWRVGGPAERFYQPADLDDLVMFVKQLPAGDPLHWVGLGSNLLVRDGGLRGTVIATSGALNAMAPQGDTGLRAEVGVASAKVARFSVNHGLRGAEFLAGIPGTVGGALAMNAGAFGGETWEIVRAVETLDRKGCLRVREKADFEVSYRHVSGPQGEWFVAAHFELARGPQEEGRELIRTLLAKRGGSQPTQTANAGSVFRNPHGDYAARLIEASGLKGICQGKACVSDVHANFIINTGGASAADIERLIEQVRRKVADDHQVILEPEVRIIGEIE